MKGRMGYWLLALLLTVSIVGPAVAQEPAGEPVRIGVATEVTGKAAMSGDHAVKGANLAMAEINAAGGVLGRPLELVIEDTQSTNPGAISAYNRLVQEDQVVAVIAPIRSTQIQSMDAMIREAQLVTVMGGTNTNLTEVGDEWLFRFRPPDKYAGQAMVEYLVEDLGLSEVGIIHDTDAFGSGGADVVEAALQAKGLAATTRQQYTTGDKDYAAQILSLKNAGSKAIVIYGTNSEDDAIILRTVMDLTPGMVIMGSPSNVAQVTIDLGGDAVEGIYSVTDFFAEAGPTTEAFVKNYGAAYDGAMPDLYASWIYDAVYGLKNAIDAAGSTDPAAIREAMFELQDIPSAEGVVNCALNGDCAHTYYVVQVENGKPKLITPINFWKPVAEEAGGASSEADAAAADHDTDFPLPANVQNFMGQGGESQINFQTTASLEDLLDFYTSAFSDTGLSRIDLLTVVNDTMFSTAFEGRADGKWTVVQCVALGKDLTNVSVRLEDAR